MSRRKPIEAESSVLGACLLDADAVITAREHIVRSDFTDPRNAIVWDCIQDLYSARRTIDEIVVVSALQASGQIEAAGGALYVAKLVDHTPSAANVGAYCEILRKSAGVRALYKASREAAKAIEDGGEVDDVFAELESIKSQIDAREPSNILDVAIDTAALMREMEDRQSGTQRVSSAAYVSTGFRELDAAIVGYGEGQLITLVGRPKMGKTAFAINSADAMARAGNRVLFFSNEMLLRQLTIRSVASTAQVQYAKLRNGTFDADDWRRATTAWSELKRDHFLVDDRTNTMRALTSIATREHRRRKLSGIFVDYAQRFAPTGGNNREQAVASVARELKQLAKDLRIPVIALAQAGRVADEENERRSRGSDVRESDVLFAESDVMMFIKRPIVYNPKADPYAATLEIVKQREGPETDVPFSFRGEYQLFSGASAWTPSPAILPAPKKSWHEIDNNRDSF